MVKNSFGGSKTKSFARKTFAHEDDENDIPLPKNKYEKIAFVSKIFGNGMCLGNIIEPDVTTNEVQQVKCHFRGKFKGKYKKNNIVSIGSFILIGLREWETTVSNADLLFVFGNPNVLPRSFTCHPSIASLSKNNDTGVFDSVSFTSDDAHHDTSKDVPIVVNEGPSMEIIQEEFEIDDI